MGGILKVIVIIILIIGITTWIQHGIEGFQNNPFQSTWDSTKDIGGKTKDAYDKTKEIIDNFKNNENSGNTNSSFIEIGKIPCSSNDDCNNLLNDCQNSCICKDDVCWKQE